MKKTLFTQIFLFFLGLMYFGQVQAQNSCANAAPFCSGTNYNFPNQTGTSAPTGTNYNYGCLGSVPNPSWYYMKIGTGGTMTMTLKQTNSSGTGTDVDFAMWGPFDDVPGGCAAISSHATPIQSSYSASSTETISLGTSGGSNSVCSPMSGSTSVGSTTPPAAQAGKYYIVLMTNYSNTSGNITLNQTSGTGSTDCSIVTTTPCSINGLTATANCQNGNSIISGSFNTSTTITTGTLTVSSSCGGSQVFNAPFPSSSSSLTYSFNGGAANGSTCTITAVYSADASCTASTTVVKSTSPPPAPNLINTPADCTNPESTTILNYDPNYTYTFSPTGPTVGAGGVINNTTAGTNYTVTVSSGGCGNSSATFTNDPVKPTPPTPVLTIIPASCTAAGTTSVANYNASYTYGFSPTGPTVGAGGVITGAVLGTSYQIAAVNQGCVSTAATFQNNAQLTIPTVSAGSNVTICSGASTTLTATGASTYSWDNGLGAGATHSVSPTVNTTYTVTGTAANGCTNTAQVTVTVSTQVTPTFTNPGTICAGTSLTLPTNSNNGIAGTWSPAVDNTQTTSYTFTPNAGQCATTATMTVPVTPLVTPTFTNPGPICIGSTFTLPTNSAEGITGAWSPAVNNTATTLYTFTPNTGQCANTATMTVQVDATVTPTFTNPGPICTGATLTLPTNSNNGITGTWSPAVNNTATTLYTFTPDAGNVCAGTATMTVVVDNQTAPTFSTIAPICSGGALTLPSNSNNGIAGTWSPAVNNTATTTYTFTPSSGACATTATMTVTINNPTNPQFTNPGPICSGATLTLPSVSNDGTSGAWSPAVNNTATTTYTFTPNTGQCANVATMNVVVNNLVTPTFNPIGPICSGANLLLPATSTNGINGTWSPAPNNTATTTYTFTPNSGQCANGTTMTVNVGTQVNPIFAITDSICQGANMALPTTSTNGITGAWTPAFDNNNTMTYTFVPDPNQCSNTITQTVNVKPSPIVNAQIGNTSICSGDSVHITIAVSPTDALIQWTATNNNTNGATSGTGNSIDDYITLANNNAGGTAVYQITATKDGCTNNPPTIVTYNVGQPLATTASLTASATTVTEGGTTNLNVTMSPYIPGVLYTWNPTSTLSCNDCPNPVATPTEATCYTVILNSTDPSICPLKDSVCISYKINCGETFVPSIFSPNQDGNNDIFRIYGRCLVKMQMSIYDRWGELVFYSDDLTEGWDGTFRGKLMNSGTFVYRISVTTLYGDVEQFSGNVTLVR